MQSNRERLITVIHIAKRVTREEAEKLISTLTQAQLTEILNSELAIAAEEYLELSSRIAELTYKQDLAKQRLNKVLQEQAV